MVSGGFEAIVLSAEVCYHHLPSSRGCISQIWDAVKGVETMLPLLSWCHTLRCDLLMCVLGGAKCFLN